MEEENKTTLYKSDFLSIVGEIDNNFFKSISRPAKNIKYKNPNSATKWKVGWSTIKAKYAAIVPIIISTGIVGSFRSLDINGEENIIKDMVIIIDISPPILIPTFRLALDGSF